jgi:hypothetical protein
MFALCAMSIPLPVGLGYTLQKHTCQVLVKLHFQRVIF